MATIHLGKLEATGGFSRPVAVKRLHAHLTKDPAFVAMLLDEAKLAGRVRHPNVVSVTDVVSADGEVLLVMEYVLGESLDRLLSTGDARALPAEIAAAVMVDVLRGLHAAHEARGDQGEPLGLVHRDVTPHNVMVRRDGSAVLVDFGVAKAAGRLNTTEEGKIKGKLPYMAPEQLRGGKVSRQSDVYSAGAVLWEALVGRRLVQGANEGEIVEQVLFGDPVAPSTAGAAAGSELDALVLRALARDPAARFATASEMAERLEAAVLPARASRVAAWLLERAGPSITEQEAKIAALEASAPDVAQEAGPDRVQPHAPARSGSWGPWVLAAAVVLAGGFVWSRGSGPDATSAETTGESPRTLDASASGPTVAPGASAVASAPSATPSVTPEPSAAPSVAAPAPSPTLRTRAAPPPAGAPKGCVARRAGEIGSVRKTVGADGTPTFVVICPG